MLNIPHTRAAATVMFSAAMLTDPGLVRDANEDSVAYILPRGFPDDDIAFAIVADGMGGHACGEIASGLAVQIVTHHVLAAAGNLPAALASGLAAANAAILARAAELPACAGMGTTCTAVALDGAHIYLAHIGDSRAYRLDSSGTLSQISVDHSAVAALVRAGRLSAADAAIHPDRNIILQALGTARNIAPQFAVFPALQPGERLLLCSDGLSDVVATAHMQAALTECANALGACQRLIAAAHAAGAPDNVSAGIIAADAAAHARLQAATRPGAIPPTGASSS